MVLKSGLHALVRISVSLLRRHASLLPIYLTACTLILVVYGWRLWLLKVRYFDQDEFEHLHGAWLIFKGMLSYRDYFEHHTPLFHFLLAPFYRFFEVETKIEDAFAFLVFARHLMWLLTGVILGLTFWLGKLWRDARVACIGALLLENTRLFLDPSLEIRPDLVAAACWLGCLVMIIGAAESGHAAGWRTRQQLAWSGVLLGSGIMATQKLLLALPGLAVAMFWYVLTPAAAGTRRSRLLNVAYLAVGVCIPIGLTLVYFHWQGSLTEFIQDNLLFNLRFKMYVPPYPMLYRLTSQNPEVVFFGGLGLVWVVLSNVRRGSWWGRDFIFVPSTLGLIGGLFVIPVAGEQYYLLFLPLVALLAGAFLVESVDKLADRREHMPLWRWGLPVILCALTIVVGLLLLSRLRAILVWGGAFAGAMILLWLRARALSLTLLLVALSVVSLKNLMQPQVWDRNTAQLNAIRYVIEHTAPTDTVMDGWTGLGVFRPHAYFYFFLSRDIRLMLADENRHALLEALRSRRVTPKLIFFDEDLREFSPAITAFLEEHYQPVGIGPIWRREEGIP